MEWILVICTAGWVLCGQEREVTYPSEAACYRAMDELYKRNRREDFKWVVCKPKSLNKPANSQANGRREAASG